MTAIGKICKGESKEHNDAQAFVGFLMDQNGSTPLANPDVAIELGFTKRIGRSIEVDMPRFYRARNHVKDRIWEGGQPCCGFRLHYREIKNGTQLALIDPSGDLGDHAVAALENLHGWMTRERQHQSESLRQIVSFETLADQALARGDKPGYRICQKAIIELDEYGTVKPTTMAELQVWVDSLA